MTNPVFPDLKDASPETLAARIFGLRADRIASAYREAVA